MEEVLIGSSKKMIATQVCSLCLDSCPPPPPPSSLHTHCFIFFLHNNNPSFFSLISLLSPIFFDIDGSVLINSIFSIEFFSVLLQKKIDGNQGLQNRFRHSPRLIGDYLLWPVTLLDWSAIICSGSSPRRLVVDHGVDRLCFFHLGDLQWQLCLCSPCSCSWRSYSWDTFHSSFLSP